MTRQDLPADAPRHGCARCYWYNLKKGKEYGRCVLTKETRYYKYPPCPEYELDPLLSCDTLQ